MFYILYTCYGFLYCMNAWLIFKTSFLIIICFPPFVWNVPVSPNIQFLKHLRASLIFQGSLINWEDNASLNKPRNNSQLMYHSQRVGLRLQLSRISLVLYACLFYELYLRFGTPVIVFVFNTNDYVIRMVWNVFTMLFGWFALKSITFVI